MNDPEPQLMPMLETQITLTVTVANENSRRALDLLYEAMQNMTGEELGGAASLSFYPLAPEAETEEWPVPQPFSKYIKEATLTGRGERVSSESASPTDEITNLAELLPDRWYAVTEDGRVFGGYTKRKHAIGGPHSTTVLGSSVREVLRRNQIEKVPVARVATNLDPSPTEYKPNLFYAVLDPGVGSVPMVFGGFASAENARRAVPGANRWERGDHLAALMETRRGA